MWSGFNAHRERRHAGGGSPALVTTAAFHPAVTAKHQGEEHIREDPTKGDPGESQLLQIQTFHLPPPQMPSPCWRRMQTWKHEHKHVSSWQQQLQMWEYAHKNDKHELEGIQPTKTMHSPYNNDEGNGDGTGAQVSNPLPSSLPSDSPCTAGSV